MNDKQVQNITFKTYNRNCNKLFGFVVVVYLIFQIYPKNCVKQFENNQKNKQIEISIYNIGNIQKQAGYDQIILSRFYSNFLGSQGGDRCVFSAGLFFSMQQFYFLHYNLD
eukprot:TRINITY_DN1269_c0_g1_i1.p4 TRINITY_DN1269_c0_g1~~TRINITY_DN1269_c0_g1_i1.p4  ORF type:complete len:111 (-),score=2.75 TRINITY_DN1269_c0_g1_i1:180-512(-)